MAARVYNGRLFSAPIFGIVACVFLLLGCSGSSGLVSTSAGPKNTALANVDFKLTLPRVSGSSAGRAPQWIPASATSITVLIYGAGTYTFPIGATAPGCTAGASSIVCAFTLSAPVGRDYFTVTAFSLSISPVPLAEGVVTQTIVANAVNTISVTMAGIPESAKFTGPSTVIPVGSAATVPFSATFADRDGDVIIGPFSAPVTISGTVSDGSSAWGTLTCDGQVGTSLTLTANPTSCSINSNGAGYGELFVVSSVAGAGIDVPFTPVFKTLYQFSKILPLGSLMTWQDKGAGGYDIAISEPGQAAIAVVRAASYLTYVSDAEYRIPSGAQPGAITACWVRSGEFCFAETGAIGVLTTAGAILEIPTPTAGAAVAGITRSGANRDAWFSEPAARNIGVLSATSIDEYPTGIADSHITGLSSIGNSLYFTDPVKDAVGYFTVNSGVPYPLKLQESTVKTPKSAPTVIAGSCFGEANVPNMGCVPLKGGVQQ